MRFASPMSLLWLSLAVPIVVFYVLKVRRRQFPVSTVMFWNQIFDQTTPRSIWQRLRHLVSLLFQLAFLGLLVFALADPFFATQSGRRKLVLVIDNSASMSANAGTTTRLEAAIERGRYFVRGLRQDDEMAIISAGTVPRIELGLTSHPRMLFDALQAIRATDGPTHVREAVALAQRFLVDRDDARIIVLTDGCFDGDADLVTSNNDDRQRSGQTVPVRTDIQVDVIGTSARNVGITQFQVRRSLIDVIGYQVLIEVTNFSSESIACRFDLTLDNDLIDVIPLTLMPNQSHQQVVDHTSSTGGHMFASLDVHDALSADNQAVAILPQRELQTVLLVTPGNLFLQSVLTVIPRIDLQTVSELPMAIPKDTILILDGATPAQIPSGNVIVVQPDASTNLWTLGEPIQDSIVAQQNATDICMTHVQLENVLLPNARRLDIHGNHHTLASSLGGETLFAAIRHPRGETLVLTGDLKQGDLPLRTAFPILMTNAINWFRGERAELRQSLATGDYVEVSLPNTDTAMNAESMVVLRAPNGSEERVSVGESNPVGPKLLGPFDQCGVWRLVRTVQADDRAGENPQETVLAEYACNLSNGRESDLRLDDSLPVSITADAGALTESLTGRPMWFYLVELALVMSAGEWFLFQRRWIS